MCFVIEIEDIFDKKRKGYLAHSDAIGDFTVIAIEEIKMIKKRPFGRFLMKKGF